MTTSRRNNERKVEEPNENHLNTIMVVERDIVRKLIVPRHNANRKMAALLSESQFSQIKENSRVSIFISAL